MTVRKMYIREREYSGKKYSWDFFGSAFFGKRDSFMRLNADWMKPNDSERRSKEYEEKSISAHNIPQTSIFPVYNTPEKSSFLRLNKIWSNIFFTTESREWGRENVQNPLDIDWI